MNNENGDSNKEYEILELDDIENSGDAVSNNFESNTEPVISVSKGKKPSREFIIFVLLFMMVTLIAFVIFSNKDKIFKAFSSSSSSNSDSKEVESVNTSKEEETKNDDSIKGKLQDTCGKVDSTGNYNYPVADSSVSQISCVSGVCTYTDESYNYYMLICATGQYTEKTWDEMKADISLSTMCSLVDSNGNYVSTNLGKCEKNICYIESNGKTYSKVCK